MNQFLKELPKEDRIIFLRRYWYCESTAEIARHCGTRQYKVRRILRCLRARLTREGLTCQGFSQLEQSCAPFLSEAEIPLRPNRIPALMRIRL